jgi:uncharacterized membrane protein YsdA (DUF1294 family)
MMIGMIRLAAYYLIIVNIAALALCMIDKRAAVQKRRRISERTLLAAALAGGAAGMFVGMLAVRHKTRKAKFIVLIPVIIVLQAVGLYLLLR